MAQYSFGAGQVFATPQTTANGSVIATPSPVEFGVLQDTSVDISFDVKELHGRQQFAVDIARGKGKLTGKAKAARLNGALLNDTIFGQTVTTGTASVVTKSVSATVIPATPNTVTVTPPNSGVYAADLGVTDAKAVPLRRVASGPTTGQYSLNEETGVYTFAAADAGGVVFINYRYTATITGSKASTVMNLDMGDIPTFSLDLYTEYKGKFLALHLYKCVSSKISFATKQDDYMIPEFEFAAHADDLGRVFTWNLSE